MFRGRECQVSRQIPSKRKLRQFPEILLPSEETQVEPYLCDSVFDNLLVGHIALVADEQLVDPLRGVTVNLL